MPAFLRGGRGGGVLGLGPVQNTFGDNTTADRAAAEALRNTYATNMANADWLAEYNNNLGNWIRLVWMGGVAEQRRNAAGDDWEDVTNVIRGQVGPQGAQGEGIIKVEPGDVTYTNDQTIVITLAGAGTPSVGDTYIFQYRENFTSADQEITININGDGARNVRIRDGASLRNWNLQDIHRFDIYEITRVPGNLYMLVGGTQRTPATGIKPYAVAGGPAIATTDAAAGFMLDSEFTAAAVQALLSLSAAEVDALLVDDNARIESGVLIIPRNDGTELQLTLPAGMGGTNDGVITGVTFAADATTMTITRSQGAAITVNIPALLRQSGVSEARVNELIAAARVTVYPAVVDSNAPVVGDFTQSASTPVLLTLGAGDHVALAYPATQTVQPHLFLNGTRYGGQLTASAATITLGGADHNWIVTTRAVRAGDTLVEWRFPLDWTT